MEQAGGTGELVNAPGLGKDPPPLLCGPFLHLPSHQCWLRPSQNLISLVLPFLPPPSPLKDPSGSIGFHQEYPE